MAAFVGYRKGARVHFSPSGLTFGGLRSTGE